MFRAEPFFCYCLSLIAGCVEVKIFKLLSCPWCSSQELQARFYGGITIETTDIDSLPKLLPAIMIEKTGYNHFQCNTMKMIIGLLFAHISCLHIP